MKIGTRVSVKTKHYGTQTGTIIANRLYRANDDVTLSLFRIKPDNHPRDIDARRRDIKVIR